MPITLVVPLLLSSVLLQAATDELLEEFDASATRTGFFKLVKTPAYVVSAIEYLDGIEPASE